MAYQYSASVQIKMEVFHVHIFEKKNANSFRTLKTLAIHYHEHAFVLQHHILRSRAHDEN